MTHLVTDNTSILRMRCRVRNSLPRCCCSNTCTGRFYVLAKLNDPILRIETETCTADDSASRVI